MENKINFIYVLGKKKMFVANALSRACKLDDESIDIDVSEVVHTRNMSACIRNEYMRETKTVKQFKC